jgi:hypothetical protein
MKYFQKLIFYSKSSVLSNYKNLTVGQKYEEYIVVKSAVILTIKIKCKHVHK